MRKQALIELTMNSVSPILESNVSLTH